MCPCSYAPVCGPMSFRQVSSRLIDLCDMTHFMCVTRDSFISWTWLTQLLCRCFIHMCDMTHPYVWPIHVCDVAHSYVWRDSFICVTRLIHLQVSSRERAELCHVWLIHMCDMAHSYVWHDLFIGMTWIINMCEYSHSWVWCDSFICVTWLIHVCVTWLTSLLLLSLQHLRKKRRRRR